MKVFGICITLAFLSMPIALFLNPMLESEYYAGFIGQDQAQVGELVRFLAEGDIVRWECLPKTSDSESYGEHNENYVVSFREPGIYTIIASVYSEGELSIHTQPVAVECSDPIPSTANQELAKKVESWATGLDSETCVTLADNFSEIASQIQNGDLTTPGQIILRTAELNSGIDAENLMMELQAYLTSQSDMGNLMTPEQHLIIWNSIVQGLRNAS